MLISDFLKTAPYYNIAIYYGALTGDLNKDILIKSLGGNPSFAFSELKRIRDLSCYCKENTNDGIPIPTMNGIIARIHDYVAAFIYAGCLSCEFVEVEKNYEPKIFDEMWLKTFLSTKEISEVKKIYSLLTNLDKSCNNDPALDADKSE